MHEGVSVAIGLLKYLNLFNAKTNLLISRIVTSINEIGIR